jgi:dihydrofolate reductase/thymidylate synthase
VKVKKKKKKNMISKVNLIFSCDINYGIGKKGKLPWTIREDIEYFRKTTVHLNSKNGWNTSQKKNAIIMGRMTYESIPKNFRPLPDRVNIVLTKNKNYRKENDIPNDVIIEHSLDSALATILNGPISHKIDLIFAIGGAELINHLLSRPEICGYVYITFIEKSFQCDTTVNSIDRIRFGVSSEHQIKELNFDLELDPFETIHEKIEYKRIVYTPRKPCFEFTQLGGFPSKFHEEYQYLDCIRNIFLQGQSRMDRTGTGTRSIFGVQMKFSLRGSFPLLTTKRMPFQTIVKELLWIISGKTDSNILNKQGVKIWNANGSKEFLNKCGFDTREEGDLGPVYGFQWRHYGAQYIDHKTDYTGQGIDQLQNCIDMIKNNPNSRRIFMTAWNPIDIPKMALPPCHVDVQFMVSNKELHCMMNQRSGDMGLGVPFNIASYSCLTIMIAHICGLTPGEFTINIGDSHIYNDHIEQLNEQIERDPFPFPAIRIKTPRTSIDDFSFEDFELHYYRHHPHLQMKMSA